MSETTNTGKKKKRESGCLPSLLMLIGIFLALYSVIGFIAGLFGYKLRVSGSEMPFVDIYVLLPLLIVASIFVGVGYAIDVFIYRNRGNKKKQ